MHVAVVAPEFPPELGGMQTYAREFARELVRRGHRVTVLTRPHAEGEVSLAGAAVLPVLKICRKLDSALVTRFRPDVWHAMNAAYCWLGQGTAPVVVSVHGNDFLRPYLLVDRPRLGQVPVLWRSPAWQRTTERALGVWRTRRLVHRTLPRVAHILANSRYTEQALLEDYPRCLGKTSPAMVGVAPDFLSDVPQRPALGRSKLITVCRLAERRKNVEVVLRALAALKAKRAFTYTVVGDGPLRPELQELANGLGLAGRVEFAGFVDSARLRDLLATSDLFVLTCSILRDSHEGFGIAYLEANACGTPVLAARLAGAIEAVDEGRSGFFVDEPSVELVTAALDRFLEGEVTFDPASCRAFASQFTWQRVVDHALRYYPNVRD